MSTRQYVVCKFSKVDRRGYTYHNDGEPLSVGDIVEVPKGRGDGTSRVEVVVVGDEVPVFATKPVLGKVEATPVEPEQTDLGLASENVQ